MRMRLTAALFSLACAAHVRGEVPNGLKPADLLDEPATQPAPALEQGADAVRQVGDATRELGRNWTNPAAWREWSEATLGLGLVILEWVIVVGLILLVLGVVMRIARRILDRLQNGRSLPDAVMAPVRRLVRGIILLLAILISLSAFGVPLGTVWATLSAVAVLIAVGFIAVWSVLSNVTCSVMLMIFKPFRIGDHVELVDNATAPGLGGRVVDLTLMYVVLKEEDEGNPAGAALIQVPNNLFFQRVIRRRAGRRAIPLEQHVDKHGLAGREKAPPSPPPADPPHPRAA